MSNQIWMTCRILLTVESETAKEVFEDLNGPLGPLTDLKKRFDKVEFVEFDAYVESPPQ